MIRISTVLALLVTACGAASAQSEIPNITGAWQIVSGDVITHDGKVLPLLEMPSGELVIEMQKGPVFRGAYKWHHPEGTALDDGQDVAHRADEAFVGVFAGDGQNFILADTPDTGYWFGQMKPNGQMELRYVESGPYGAAGYSIMQRVD